MEYPQLINDVLRPKEHREPVVIDLFAGCGGLALGFESQGFETIGYEMDSICCDTYNRNLKGKCICETLTPETELPKAGVVIGGPPCQPFSVVGKQNGLIDSRDGFPIFISAVKRLNPDIFLFENVRGLLYRSKSYFELILKELKSLGYIMDFQVINAVNYQVPQNRERLIVIGHRGNFSFPKKANRITTVSEALGELAKSAPPESRFLTKSMDEYIARYEKASKCIRPRDLRLNAPARTLTCRNLAGATSDMQRILLPDGRRRRLLPREAARLQSFPDWFEFEGTENQVFNQIGNAVPPLLSCHLAASIRDYLESSVRFSSSEIAYRNLPAQLDLRPVPDLEEVYMPEFLELANKKKPTKYIINDALYILQVLGIPFESLTPRRLERMAMAFLAVCDVNKPRQWSKLKDSSSVKSLTTRQIIDYVNAHFEENISSGSYDDIRRQDLKLLTAAGIVLKSANNPNAATNNPTRAYALNPEYTPVIASFGSKNWEEDAEEFLSSRETLTDKLADDRPMNLIPVKLPSGVTLNFSQGRHNLLQKAIIEDFLPRYGEGAEVLYVGDTVNKFLHLTKEKLESLKFFELSHEELPDIIAYSEKKNWLYLIEAVYSSGPVSNIRHEELKKLTSRCTADIIYITAFLERTTFRKFAPEISWETEVWIAEYPDHLIHFDGKRFLGPYKQNKGK